MTKSMMISTRNVLKNVFMKSQSITKIWLIATITIFTAVACQGAIGPQGIDGPVGPEGPQGIDGPEGQAGPSGADGKTGDVGPVGATGPKGDKGERGADGSLAVRGQICPAGSGIAGFDAEGDIICTPFVIATATLVPLTPPSAQESTGSDSTPPQIQALEIEPQVVLAGSGDQTVRFTIAATDDLSGIESITLFISTSTGGPAFGPSPTRISGTETAGIWLVEINIPQFSPTGIWRITEIHLQDRTLNLRRYLDSELYPDVGDNPDIGHIQDLGVQNTFTVG